MTEPREITIRIEGRPPTPNVRPGHWRQRYASDQTWKNAAMRSAQAQMPPDFGPPIELAEMEVVFVLPDLRDRDLDNLVGSSKVLTDGLKAAKVIRDDSLKVIRHIGYGWRIERGLAATVYTIREIPQERLGL